MDTVNPLLVSSASGLKMDVNGGEMSKNPTLICAPIMADSIDKMVTLMAKAKASTADLVEIRLDSLNNFNPFEDLNVLIKQCPLPTLFTYRPVWEGGQYGGDEKKRLDVLRLAMELGADYIDVELKVAHEFIKSIGGKKPEKFQVIVSSHNYQSTPSVEELGNLVVKIQSTGADIVKIATTAIDITDVARIFQITVHSQVPIIGLVMGERGLISRILCTKFGGYLTFGTLEAGVVSAPGQPTINDLLNLYNFRQLGPDTKVYGIIGKPVGHSKSPVLYNEAFKSAGFNGVFVHLLVDDLEMFLRTYSSTDFAGFRFVPVLDIFISHGGTFLVSVHIGFILYKLFYDLARFFNFLEVPLLDAYPSMSARIWASNNHPNTWKNLEISNIPMTIYITYLILTPKSNWQGLSLLLHSESWFRIE
ncbi:hypothetical protein V6Z12_A09G076100 [Gossypium hirsutum]